MMKRLLTYGLMLLTILASHFVVSACQDDLPETTEVMMTFTTRALIKQDDANAEINAEQLRTLHVIMRKSDGTIYHASRKDIQENQVTVTFEDVPVSAGEEFEFFAIANQEGIVWDGTAYDVSNPTAEMLSNFPDLRIGNGGVYDYLRNHLIPQTKYWKEKIYPLETIKIGKQLDFAVGKISVQFVNETNNNQSLNNIKVTGVKPNGYGYLFAPIEGGNRVEDYYQHDVDTEIGFESVNIQAGASSSIQHYYTYPIDAANITNPQFTAQWNGTHTLNLSELKELKRGQHLKIVVTLSGVGIQVNYNIVDWVENTTTIGGLNSTLGDDYFIAGWEDDDVVIGGEDEPKEVGGLTISANPATIDLASATATTTLTINKPANITAITITPSDNSAFTGLTDPTSGSITDYFNITDLSDAAGTVYVTLRANSKAATGSYTLTASGTGGDDYISNEDEITITLSKTPSGGGENPDDDLGNIVKNYTPVWNGELKYNNNHNLSSSCSLNFENHLVAGNSVIVGFIYNDERSYDNYTVWFKTSWEITVLSDRFGFTKDSETHYVSLDLTSEMINKIKDQDGLFLAVSEDCIKINSVYIIPSTN